MAARRLSPLVAALALTTEFNTFFKKGAAPDWTQMDNGNWASSTTYANTVVTMYGRMLDDNDVSP